ncbi:hypothetical protein [Bhargavaea cecembensis]|uniref:hypothetical protein n=1 Tax=Bhargavaea cecembensis TaxID=394098 RepID=UPI0005909D8A|nr:hypothetical protein [Bhargavaea cecembensis]
MDLLTLQQLERLASVTRLQHPVALIFQIDLDSVADLQVVVHDQHRQPFHRIPPLSLLLL